MAETVEETTATKTTSEKLAAPKRKRLQNQIALPEAPPRVCQGEKLIKRALDWWNKVHKRDPDRLTGMVYRYYPVCIKPKRQHAHYHLTEPPSTEMDFYAHPNIGCGDYRIYLNDAKEKGKTWCEILLKGFRDYRNYPPYVNLDELAWNDPANEPFITAMQLQGRIPSQEEHEMEKSSAGMGDALANLSQTVTELAGMHLRQPREQSMDGRLSSTLIESVMATRNMEREMMRETTDEIRKMQGGSADPVAQFEKMVGIITPLMAKSESPINMIDVLRMLQEQDSKHLAQIAELNNQRIQAIEKSNEMVLKLMTEKKDSSEESDIDKFIAVRQKMNDLGLGGGSDSEPDKISRYLALGSALLPSATQLINGIVTASYNYAIASKNPETKPIPPPTPEEIERQNQEIRTIQGSEQERQQAVYLQFLDGIKGALVTHISSTDLTGEDFADWLIRSQPNGIMIYRALREQENAKQALLGLLQQHTEIWGAIGGAPQTVDRFLDEFLTYDETPQPESTPEGVTEEVN